MDFNNLLITLIAYHDSDKFNVILNINELIFN